MGHKFLTNKQEAFVQAYMRTDNAYQAYLESYTVKPTTHRATVEANASRLIRNSKVSARIAQLREEKSDKLLKSTQKSAKNKADAAEITVETVTHMLEKAYAKAENTDNGSAAMTAAALGLAKVKGFIVNKSEDVTPRRNSKEVLDRLRQLSTTGAAGGDSEPARRASESGRARKNVPTVPGHGTA